MDVLIPLFFIYNREEEQETQKEERLMEEKKKKKQEEKKKKEGAQKKVGCSAASAPRLAVAQPVRCGLRPVRSWHRAGSVTARCSETDAGRQPQGVRLGDPEVPELGR